jgi:TPP-dependent pyruvate/acetoin dehydrogenase alpha subunit
VAGSSTGGSLISDTKLKQLYATMLSCRLLTEHARRLDGRRRNLYSASLGQEAIVTGCAIDLQANDTLITAAHEPIASLAKGAKPKDLIAQLYAGDSATASDSAAPLTMANEAATKLRRKHKRNVVVAFAARPATAADHWKRTLKFSIKHKLPIMFVVENNGQASAGRKSQPRPVLQEPIDGLTSMVVDGNDVVAVYRVAFESLGRIRQGDGPVLIEARPYLQDGRASLRAERDPLLHMERYLSAKKLFTERWKNQLIQHFSRDLDDAIQALDAETTRYLRASHTVAND